MECSRKCQFLKTNLLSAVQHGQLVEIDTQVGLYFKPEVKSDLRVYFGLEVVQRVRILAPFLSR